ncbi:MAG: hypothetical protein AB1649_27195 [Chloroflexota bacterium]
MPDFRRKPKKLIAPKVLVIDFRPAAVPAAWNSTDKLIQGYIDAMRELTEQRVLFRVVEKATVTDFPPLVDGRKYTNETWQETLRDDKKALRDSHGNYMMADYLRIVRDFNILAKVRDRIIDEVWMFGGPYFGFYESRMVGRGAFWCNAPAIEQPGRLFVMMGYNYERDVKEMVHDFGHRAESMLCARFDSQGFLQQLYSRQALAACKNDYEEWLLEHGTVHRKPGGEDYGQDEFAWVKALKPEWIYPAADPNQVKGKPAPSPRGSRLAR